MDLFHAITQEIENVLSCHWLTEFRETHRTNSNSTNSSRSNSPNRDSTSNSSNSSSSPVASPPSRQSSSASIVSKNTSSPILSRSNSSFSNSAETNTNSGMADGQRTKMMDTEPGGEQTQYEGYKGLNEPHDKQSGQLGANVPNTTEAQDGVDADRAQRTTENIRYGQNVSESGVGGFTNTSAGSANQEGGYGGAEAQSELEQGKNPRTSQGYSAKDGTHDYKVGG